jgi:hypothetical protein
VVLLQLESGRTDRLDPRVDADLCLLDKPKYHRQVRRVSLLDDNGRRVDLPLNKNGIYTMWIERVEKNDEIRGERFCMKTKQMLFRATMYYSDGRVVFDIDPKGGFMNG